VENKVSKDTKWIVASVGAAAVLTIGAVFARTQPKVVYVPKVVTVAVSPTATPSATLSPRFKSSVSVAPVKSATVPAVKK
jgi:hypothetical protein